MESANGLAFAICLGLAVALMGGAIYLLLEPLSMEMWKRIAVAVGIPSGLTFAIAAARQ